MTPVASVSEIYQLRCWFRGISPLIWRRLWVTNDTTIADLHHILQIVLGWPDTYLHQFLIHGKAYGIAYEGGMNFSDNPRKVKLSDFQFHPKERFVYEYNFFDNWQLDICFEQKQSRDENKCYPVCIGGRRTAPPEDCGGPRAFMKQADEYHPRRLETLLLDHIMCNKSERDDEYFEESLETIVYWATLHQFRRQPVNQRLFYFSQGDDRWQDDDD